MSVTKGTSFYTQKSIQQQHLPAKDADEFTIPWTNPACFGAISKGEIPDPKVWKLLVNMATVVARMATEKEVVKPRDNHKNELVRKEVPGRAPAAFIIPKTEPECFGAMSVGLTTTAMLWKPDPVMQAVINRRAGTKDFV
jgi:hypothetical protein